MLLVAHKYVTCEDTFPELCVLTRKTRFTISTLQSRNWVPASVLLINTRGLMFSSFSQGLDKWEINTFFFLYVYSPNIFQQHWTFKAAASQRGDLLPSKLTATATKKKTTTSAPIPQFEGSTNYWKEASQAVWHRAPRLWLKQQSLLATLNNWKGLVKQISADNNVWGLDSLKRN